LALPFLFKEDVHIHVHVHEYWIQIEHDYYGLQDIKGKKQMEEDEIFDHSLVTCSENTIGVFNLCCTSQCYSL
jgi:hypothetical protein